MPPPRRSSCWPSFTSRSSRRPMTAVGPINSVSTVRGRSFVPPDGSHGELDPPDLRAAMLRPMPDVASLAETLGSVREATRRLDFLCAYDQACHAQQTWPEELELEYEAIFALANLGAISGATQRLARLDRGRIDAAEAKLALKLKTLRARLLKDQ